MANNSLENLYNIGEPVSILAWVEGITSKDGELVYTIQFRNDNQEIVGGLNGVPEDYLTTGL